MMDVDQDIDDDTHICLKCRTTITGLDNYVKHRKSGCASRSTTDNRNITTPDIVDVTPSIPKNASTSPSHDENDPPLKADDFFSSLELQSSAKKTGTSPGSSNKSPSGVLTRSKATAVIQAHTPAKDAPQSVKTDSDLISSFSSDHFDTSASACLMKPDTRDHLMMKDDERSDQEDSACEEESNEEYDEDDEDEDDDAMNDGCPPRSHTGGKWKPGGLMTRGSPPSWTRTSSSSTHGDEYRGTSTGDWSLLLDECPSSSAVTTEQAAPPPHFTGGKWKPTLPNQSVINSSQMFRSSHSEDEDEVLNESLGEKSDSHGRRLSNTSLSRGPPPGHTRGKWVPGKHVRLGEGAGSANSGSSEVDSMMHVPPLRKLGSTVQYWCGPCNRRLSSRTLYERHLLSELHFKRTLKERELEEGIGQSDALNRGTDKRTVKRTEVYLNSDIWQKSKRRRMLSGVNAVTLKPKKKHLQRREEVCCEVCKSKVWRHLMGKHLVSHYHCRKARSGHAQHINLVLENIHSVVKQAPFQCSPCKFYCNTMSNFKQHWISEEHKKIDAKLTGRYWCSFCKHVCETSAEMERHLESTIHRELVAVINRSVPNVIRKISVLSCGSCGQEFRYNMELRHHGIRSGHQELNTGSDEYQERFPCPECHFIGTSSTSFQRHTFLAHKSDGTSKKGAYFCSACSLNFDTSEESAQHRRSPEHKYNSLASRKKRGLTEDDLTKSCPHCGGNFENILLLKTHLREQHAEFPYRCAHCGMAFTLPQEVSRHVRERACIFPVDQNKPETSPTSKNEIPKQDTGTNSLPDDIEHEEETRTSQEMLGCSMCPYRTDSRAELLFHEVLHGNPLSGSAVDDDADPQNQVARYRCPICSREFRKASLRCHLRTHTEERPFICSICFRGFGHRSSMVTHIRQTHRQDVGYICELCSFRTRNKASMERHRLTHTDRNKPFLCAVCGASFFLKNTLQQHMKVHTGKDIKCQFEGCIFACRSQAELRNHQQVHSENRPYKCDSCNYSAKTKPQLLRHQTVHQMTKAHQCPHCPFAARMASHLRRHLRLHTGAKPYRCPYCFYSCNILENLRKHVLSTSKHPGKMLYECRFCEEEDTFKTNLAKDFRVHLVTSHPDQFGSAMLAASYVAGIYDANDDPKFIDKPIQIQPKWRRTKTSTVISDHDCLAKPRRDEQQEKTEIHEPKVLAIQSNEERFNRDISVKTEASSSSVSLASIGPNQKIHHDQSEDVQQQLLSMVVVTDPTDDVIYIQLPPDSEGEAMERYCDSVFFPNEGDSFLSVEHLDKRRSSGDRSANIGSEATIMFPLGVDEVEEIQETEAAVTESEQMVVIKENSMTSQTQERELDEEMTVITVPSSTSTGMGDFMRFTQEMPQQHLSEATNPQNIERFEFQVSSETTENYGNVDSQTLGIHSTDSATEDQEPSYVVILK